MNYTNQEFETVTSIPCKSVDEINERFKYIHDYWRHNHIDAVHSIIQVEWFGIKKHFGRSEYHNADEVLEDIIKSQV